MVLGMTLMTFFKKLKHIYRQYYEEKKYNEAEFMFPKMVKKFQSEKKSFFFIF